jgi:hypothetical protein
MYQEGTIRRALDGADPGQQFIVVGVAAEAVERFHTGIPMILFTEDTHDRRLLHQPSA